MYFVMENCIKSDTISLLVGVKVMDKQENKLKCKICGAPYLYPNYKHTEKGVIAVCPSCGRENFN